MDDLPEIIQKMEKAERQPAYGKVDAINAQTMVLIQIALRLEKIDQRLAKLVGIQNTATTTRR